MAAAVKLPRLRLPASPVENSLEGRAFVFSGFALAVLAVGLYGEDYIIPPVGVGVAAVGHLVHYRERAPNRGLGRQVPPPRLVFPSLGYFLADSVGALFGG